MRRITARDEPVPPIVMLSALTEAALTNTPKTEKRMMAQVWNVDVEVTESTAIIFRTK